MASERIRLRAAVENLRAYVRVHRGIDQQSRLLDLDVIEAALGMKTTAQDQSPTETHEKGGGWHR